MNVVAEGLERPEHLSFLRDQACDVGQGSLFSKPLPPDVLAQSVSNWQLVMRQEFFPQQPPYPVASSA